VTEGVSVVVACLYSKGVCAAVFLLILAGCATTAKGPGAAYVSPDFDLHRPLRIALCPVQAQGKEIEGADLFERLLEEAVSSRSDYQFTDSRTLRRCAARNDLEPELEEFIQSSVTAEVADSTLSSILSRRCRIDAFLTVRLLDWEEIGIASNQEGYPQSIVEAQMKLFDGKTGRLLWSVSRRRLDKGPYYSPYTSLDRKVDSGGLVRSASPRAAAVPPPIRSTAQELLQTILKELP